MAPLAAAAAIIIPGLQGSGPIMGEGEALMTPAHWWQAELTEEQMATLSASWGKSLNAAQLLEALWPGVLQELPEEARDVYGHQSVFWPAEGYEEWDGSGRMCAGSGVPHDGGQWVYSYFVGRPEWEVDTLVMNTDRGFTEDGMYRVSLYISEQPE